MKTRVLGSPARGYIALITAIVISAILIAFITETGMEAYFARFSVTDSWSAERSRAAANACAWIALLTYAEDSSYAPHEEVKNISPDGANTCSIDSLSTNGASAIIRSHAHIQGAYRKSIITLEIMPSLTVKNWENN